MAGARSSRRGFLAAGAATIGLTVAGCLGDNTDEWESGETFAVASATQYQGPNCDCCDVYADYLADHLESDLETVTTDDLAGVKAGYGIAEPLQSCHTVVLDGTIVEGHVPVEVVGSALSDDVTGIALPGMPAGSPGMGGEKDETWTVYELEDGGEPAVYTEL
ncbi:Uncharacterized conserved protein [Natronobacterium texcoconense]|uniref:Uncharacterized conserved protein n=2 Tax=Natronobacterium texcoconense TaxID=1095778 RepID=A0A1H1I2Z9_NATTX|nr:Uncharacterized conserved protein [Natronobacterium texcoconense]